jgi:uncharacterized protein YndB with AHSA1/START domain
MLYPDTFQISTPGDRQIEVRRDFHAPRELVFDAFTKPELVRRWLLGPPGWSMPVCEIDFRVGGKYRYVWRKDGGKDGGKHGGKDGGKQMGIAGEFREAVTPERIVATERFDEFWYAGEAIVTTAFAGEGDITAVKITILYESQESRDTAKRSGMERGMAASYDRLEEQMAAMVNLPAR